MLSLTMWVHLHSFTGSFSRYCLPNVRNPANFQKIQTYSSSRSSTLLPNGKCICDFLLIINFVLLFSRYWCICSLKITCLLHPTLIWYTAENCIWWATIPLLTVLSSFKIAREFELLSVQGHPRSSIFVSIDKSVCNFLLVINGNIYLLPF